MFRQKTVVILGAGASKEARLPTGDELKEQIRQLLDIRVKYSGGIESGDAGIADALISVARRLRLDPNAYLQAGRRIRNGLPQSISIDNFIDLHQGDDKLELCGKLAIVSAILIGERQSLLYFDRTGRRQSPEFETLDRTWYNSFVKLLTQGCPVGLLQERLSKLSFVVFNYDRCLEHFLYHSIQNVYGLSPESAADLMKSVSILHPYGVIGRLPWQGGEQTIEFGAEAHSSELLALANGIKTFTEGTDPDSSDILSIRAQIPSASVVLFLGFAYHQQNLDLIRSESPHPDPDVVRYYGTAYGMSTSDSDMVASDLVRVGSAKPEHIVIRNDLTCDGIFREYWRSLSLG